MSALAAESRFSRAFAVLGPPLVAILVVPAGLAAAAIGPRQIFAGGAGLALVALALAKFRTRDVLLFLFVAALTYNRQFFSFEWLHGDLGARGLYWSPSDVFLAALLANWLFERARGLDRVRPTGAMAAWLIPLLAAAVVSATLSKEPVGSAFEVARLVKLAILLVYLRHNLDTRAAATVILAFATVTIVQTPIAILHVIFGSGQGGLTSILLPSEPDELSHRASGTLGHPNFLAPYLLLVTPGFAAVALGARSRRIKLAAGVVATAGLLTIVLTQSRSPILLAPAAVAGAAGFLLCGGAIVPKRAVGAVVAALVIVTIVALPLSDRIYSRVSGDFKASVDFRQDYNAAAAKMWETRPLLGLGPNNFVLDLQLYAPKLKLLNDLLVEETERAKANLKSSAPVHNVYLLILSELGLFGLLGFLLFVARALALAVVAARSAPMPAGLLAAGIGAGTLAQLGQQFVDYSLWWDPLLFTFALQTAVCARIASSS